MTSRWEGIPLDILYQQVDYLNTPKQIQDFCGDPYVYEKLCKDPDGEIWKYLYQRDLSDEIVLKRGDSIMSKYLREKEKLNKLRGNSRRFEFGADNEYIKILENIDLTTIPKSFLGKLLFRSILNNRFYTVKYLLDNYNIIDDPAFPINFDELLEIAAGNGYLRIVQYLIENFPDSMDIGQGLTSAAGESKLSIVRYLLEQGADVHYDNEKPLRSAANSKNLKEIKTLIRNGADINKAMNVARNLREWDIYDYLRSILPEIEKRKLPTKTIGSPRCTQITKAGTQCCRAASDESPYCFQHKDKK